jgi:hypothetical protein
MGDCHVSSTSPNYWAVVSGKGNRSILRWQPNKKRKDIYHHGTRKYLSFSTLPTPHVAHWSQPLSSLIFICTSIRAFTEFLCFTFTFWHRSFTNHVKKYKTLPIILLSAISSDSRICPVLHDCNYIACMTILEPSCMHLRPCPQLFKCSFLPALRGEDAPALIFRLFSLFSLICEVWPVEEENRGSLPCQCPLSTLFLVLTA